jgi:hypothetical protein
MDVDPVVHNPLSWILAAIQSWTSDSGQARAATPNCTGGGKSFAEIFR